MRYINYYLTKVKRKQILTWLEKLAQPLFAGKHAIAKQLGGWEKRICCCLRFQKCIFVPE